METTLPAENTQHTRSSAQPAMAVDHARQFGGLSRIVDRDIEILRLNLVQHHDSRYEARSSSWERLESTWEAVRSELTDDSTTSPLTGDLSRRNGAAVAAVEVDAPMTVVSAVPAALGPMKWFSGVLRPAISSRTRQVVGWTSDPARRADLRAAAFKVRSVISSAASAGAQHVRNGWHGLEGIVRRQAESLVGTRSRLQVKWQTWNAARAQSAEKEASASAIGVASPAALATGLLPPVDAPAAELPRNDSDLGRFERQVEAADGTHRGNRTYRGNGTHRGNGSTTPAHEPAGAVHVTAREGSAQLRLECAKETVKSKLLMIEGESRPIPATSPLPQLADPTTSSPDMPFGGKPLPWVLGALSPVISARTMMMHHGSYYSQCIESANRLAREHKNLAGKNSLEILRWAREHARGTELLATASEAWNHSFFWECLTPGKKRPTGELRKALDRKFGDFSKFADEFALAGATHVGSGWLWLTANNRKQVRILTTSDADCPEARGHTCLMAVDLWEHAYYFDHQNRRREYLDALIDRRLDWDFAEQRFRHVLQSETQARRKTSVRAVDHKRSRQAKPKRKTTTSRR